MIIIHGENTVNSRQKLVEVMDQKKALGQEIVRLESKSLSEANLEEVLGTSDLFGTQKTIVIEELHSLPKSKKKNTLVELLQSPQTHEIILWEKRTLTKTMLKAFPSAQIFELKISKTLFTWLDALGKPGNESKKLQLFHDAVETDGEYFCFLMLLRQIKLLIQAKSGGKIGGAPFMITKLNSQAQHFSLEKLLLVYKQLLEFDYAQKTSKNLLTLIQQLDLLTLKL